jgi:cell wall-associated NlpC family hydrolase
MIRSRGRMALVVLLAGLAIVAVVFAMRQAGQGDPTPDYPAARLQLGTVAPTRPIRTSAPAVATQVADTLPTALPPATHTIAPAPVDDGLAVVKAAVADVRALATPASELVTQVLMGEKIRILSREGDWYEIVAVEQPSPKHAQGYPGWVLAEAVSLEVPDTPLTAVVTALSAQVVAAPEDDAPSIANLSLDSRLSVQSAGESWVEVILPNGVGWVPREQVHLVCTHQGCQGTEGTAQPDPPRSLDDVLDTAMQFVGTPYLWGGASSDAFDCSGFVYRLFHANGITIPRDSQPMSENGAWVEKEDLRPGDVVFLAENAGSGRVTHCSLYIGDGQMVTSVGTSPIGIVPLEHPRYIQEYWGARRFSK